MTKNKTGYKHIYAKTRKNKYKESRVYYNIVIYRKGKVLYSLCLEMGTTLEEAVEKRNTKVYPYLGIEIDD
tara:strand:+ start:14 stop:226 length:213 start_codon:yes stop_codon:yes gene_type:complete